MRKLKGSNQVKIGVVISYIAIVFNIISGIIYTPWMITQIGQSDYGLYTLAYSLITMFIMDFGMSAAVTRFLSNYRAKNDRDSINKFLGIVYKLYIAIDAIIFIVLLIVYFGINDIYANLSASEIQKFRILYVIVGLFSIFSFPFTNLNGILTSHEKFIELKLCDLFHKLITVLLMVIALLCGYGVYALVLVNAFSGLLTILIKYIIIKKRTDVKADFGFFDKIMFRNIFSFSAWTTVSSIAQRLIFNITPSIIVAVSATGTVGVAVFGLASTIESYVYTFANAINGMFMPTISKIIVGGKKDDELMPLMVKIGRIQLIIIGVIVVGFISFGKSFIVDIWGKSEFLESYLCAVFLILPSLLYLPMQIANTTLIVENKVKIQAAVFVIMGITNLVLSLILSRFMGAMGASISICIAYMLRTVLMAVIHHRVLKIDMIYFSKQTYLKFAPCFFIMTAVGLLLEYFNPIDGKYLRFIVNVLIFVLMFVLILFGKVLNSYEKNLFLNQYRQNKKGMKK